MLHLISSAIGKNHMDNVTGSWLSAECSENNDAELEIVVGGNGLWGAWIAGSDKGNAVLCRDPGRES
jgi:hypothetical protein